MMVVEVQKKKDWLDRRYGNVHYGTYDEKYIIDCNIMHATVENDMEKR